MSSRSLASSPGGASSDPSAAPTLCSATGRMITATSASLGMTFRGEGKDEAIKLLRFLANQPRHHASRQRKLCARFVADEPPDGCVDAAVATWQKTEGDIRAVLRAIFTSPDFWAPQTPSGPR